MEISKDQLSKYELPNELWLKIFDYVPFEDLLNIRLVSKSWCNLAQSASVVDRMALNIGSHNWKDICKRSSSNILNYKHVRMDGINFTNADFKALQYLGSNVRDLEIRQCTVVGDNNLNQGLFNNLNQGLFPKVEFLQIDNIVLSHPKCLCFVSSTLKRLHLDFCEQSSADNALCFIEKAGDTLTELKLKIYIDFGILPSNIERAFGSIKNLQILDINEYISCGVLKQIFMSLSERNNLKKITVSALAMDDDLLKFIITKWSRTLKDIILRKPSGISNKGISQLTGLNETLTDLYISECKGVTGADLINGIARITNKVLQSLHLLYIQNIGDVHLNTLCTRLPNLKELSVEGCDKTITINSLKAISNCLTKLKVLNLVASLNDEAIVPFNYLKRPSLKILRIGYDQPAGEELRLEQFVRWQFAMEELHLSGCSMLTDESIFVIATQLKELRYLDISACENLTEQSVHYIVKNCKNLKELRMLSMNFWSELAEIVNGSKLDLKIVTDFNL